MKKAGALFTIGTSVFLLAKLQVKAQVSETDNQSTDNYKTNNVNTDYSLELIPKQNIKEQSDESSVELRNHRRL